ncbi:MAG: riboflavin kinase [Rikenellaceae bacterium]
MIVRGIVVHGRSLGRKLGFPTANVSLHRAEAIDNGVYRSRVVVGSDSYRAISNVGTKPTVGGAERNLECHILDFEGDIYGREVEVELLEKLRDEIRFASLDELQAQIKLDIEKVRNLKIE